VSSGSELGVSDAGRQETALVSVIGRGLVSCHGSRRAASALVTPVGGYMMR
jgi:hypothetical protein